MIWVTGDLHGLYDTMWKFDTEDFANKVKPEDYIIVCGDFGLLWEDSPREQQGLDEFDNRVGTYLFVDGNHENFSLINKYPVEEWNGGLVHRIRPSIIHLMRGQVFTIEGKKIFTMGGGTSIDKAWRVEGETWWPEEIPSTEEFQIGIKNLEENNWEVDYICTHVAPDKIHDIVLSKSNYKPHDILTNYLEVVDDRLSYTKWFFGHYHADKTIYGKYHLLYEKVIPMYEEEKMNNKLVIRISGIEEVKRFVSIVSKFPSDVDVKSGRYLIDAKSLMGLFALNLLNPVEVEIHSVDSEEIQRFNEALKDFICEA